MELLTLLLFTLLCGYFIAIWFFFKRRDDGRGNIPKVSGGLPLLGHAVEYGTDPVGFLQRCKERYGNAFQIRMLSNTYVIVDATYRKQFFELPGNLLEFDEAMIKTLAPDYTTGRDAILNNWHVPILRHSLSTRTLQPYARRIEQQVNAVIKTELGNLSVGQSTVVDDTQMLAWRIIASCSASSFPGDDICNRRDIINVFINFHEACFQVIQMSQFLPNSMLWLVTKSVKEQNAIVKAAVVPEVERRRELLRTRKGYYHDLPDDVLTMFLKKKHPAEVIAERMMALIFASMFTSAGVMEHALYDLAGRKEQWDVLLKEQEEVHTKHGADITPTALEAMQRLHAFVWESMRFAALPIQQVRLIMKEDVELEPGLRLPNGALVGMSGILGAFDEKVFLRASEFVPDRFFQSDGTLPAEPDKVGLFPFGIGRRICPGRHFALAEVKGALAVLIRNYRFHTVSANVPGYKHTPTDTSRIKEPVHFLRTGDATVAS